MLELLNMSETFPVLNTNIDYEKEFLDKYSRRFEFPSARCLNAFFHPTLRDCVITINEIKFPKVKADQVICLFHDLQSENFENKMKNKYVDSVSHLIVIRRNKLGTNLLFKKEENENNESTPKEPNTSEFFESSSSYEGGQEEFEYQPRSASIKSTKAHPNQKVKRRVDTHNQIVINAPPKLKGVYPKIDTKIYESKKLSEIYNNSKVYSKAVDLYLEDHSSLFGYQDFDESMKPDEQERDPANYINPDDEFRIDEYLPEKLGETRILELLYSPIPVIDELCYMPPPFRHKFEIWVWRVDTHNASKIKHWYFTPEASKFSFLIKLYLPIFY